MHITRRICKSYNRFAGFTRKSRRAFVAGGVGVAALLSLAGCSSIPTPEKIRSEYEIRATELLRWKDEALRNCEGTTNPSQCKSDILNQYTQLKLQLLQAQNKAIDGNWDEARKSREAWDEAMRQKFKELGLPNIKDFLQSGLITTDISIVPDHVYPARGGASGQGGSTSTGSGGVYYEPPCIYETVTVNGTVSAGGGDSDYSTYVSGSLVVCWDTMAEPGTLRGQIISGELGLWSTYPPITLTLDPNSVRTIEANEAGGGRLQAWFKISIPFTPWAAIMRDMIYFDLPLTYSPESGFALALNNASVDSLVPRYRSPFSDFNHDGVYNHDVDLASFMAAFDAHDLRTDRNVDGVWDQLDIDIWNEEFARDSTP